MTFHLSIFRVLALTAAALVLTALGPEPRAQEGQFGGLTCSRIEGSGFNIVIYSKADVRCIFKGSAGTEQWYVGNTGVAFGVDLKWKKSETIALGVLSSTMKFEPEGDFLSGYYAGAKADAALGVGAGVAILLGGSEDTVALQPAVTGGTGVGIAAGLGYLEIKPDPLNLARMATPGGLLFSQVLYGGYFDQAYQHYQRPAYEASDYFSDKAIAAAGGTAPEPDDIGTWPLTDAQRPDVAALRGRVLAARADPTGRISDAAMAQVGFDCWLYALAKGAAQEQVAGCWKILDRHLKTVELAVAERRARIETETQSSAENWAEAQLMTASWHMVLFATDKSKVDERANLAIKNVLQRVSQLKQGRLFIKGNTDRVGPKTYNLALSERRADAVTIHLRAAGVPAAWISEQAFGEENPVSISRNPHDALNRRVDVVVVPLEVKREAVLALAAERRKRQ